jgi:predicted RNase H-like HicB family nuclease
VEYVVLIHAAEEGGYWAEVPALEGCFSQGETIEELLDDARGAIQSHVEALKEDGQPVPRSSSIVVATDSMPEPAPA